MMPGRRYAPGEVADPMRARSDVDLSRHFIGQIVSINPELGVASVRVRGFGKDYACLLPNDVFPDGQASSWSVRMPRKRQFVLVAFSIDDVPVIVRVYPFGASARQTTTPRDSATYIGGYARMQDFADRNPRQYLDWRPFAESEFGDRTLGGALIRGTNQGDVYVSGGRSVLRVSKGANGLSEIVGETGRWRLDSGPSYLLLGEQRRQALPLDLTDSPVVGAVPLGSELRYRVANTSSVGLALPVAERAVGGQISTLPVPGGVAALPVLSSNGSPLIDVERHYTGQVPEATAVAVRESLIDAQGNQALTAPLSVAQSLSAPLAAYTNQTRTQAFGLAPTFHSALAENVQAALNAVVAQVTAYATAVGAAAALPVGSGQAVAAASTAFAQGFPQAMQALIAAIPSSSHSISP